MSQRESEMVRKAFDAMCGILGYCPYNHQHSRRRRLEAPRPSGQLFTDPASI